MNKVDFRLEVGDFAKKKVGTSVDVTMFKYFNLKIAMDGCCKYESNKYLQITNSLE